jgi:hypothetical protein
MFGECFLCLEASIKDFSVEELVEQELSLSLSSSSSSQYLAIWLHAVHVFSEVETTHCQCILQ